MFEFLFCPVHGVLRPANWPLILPTLIQLRNSARGLLVYVYSSAMVRHVEHLRRTGVL